MISPSTYSTRTICPECNARVRLEDVRFTPSFPCPACGKEVHVSDRYRHVLQTIGWLLGLVVPYAVGARSWVLLLVWIPCTMIVFSVWGYTGKYLVPPRLQTCASQPPSILGLGPK